MGLGAAETTDLCMLPAVVPGFAPWIVVVAAGLRAKREELGMSRQEVSLLTGIPVGTLWEIEAGTRGPGPEQRVALMRALDSEFDELFAVSAVNRRP
jgi:transcriptional regulator with XRE-family HTH domain